MKNQKTQMNNVKNHLKRYGHITSWEAITLYKITRLSHYILVLRKEGYEIVSVYERKNKKNYVRYILN